ncbi:MAG: class I SAM-dependent methyltransferase [Candidatus Methanomethylophilus sp.]|nr:class I SAM-dependent methyltransferase [Methanomethylophilus sp.]MDD3233167.1 class I SAM-dependent methyltransferase [Methanomethylophilus sp.]MDD4222403.1 class I SAM-dependent methyltransferase [Methanomethylophilus sp.]MDD4669150.1 class I SAM-dependent methyltransferase [Methanomethylophilus sp.]
MEPDEVRRQWRDPVRDSRPVAAMWDLMADDFAVGPVPDDSDPFVKLIRDNWHIGPQTRILDIGCGTGGYTVRLAAGAQTALGLDISPAMLRAAADLAVRSGAHNVRFELADWNVLSPAGPLLKDGFDIVYARLSPAIRSAASFEKMIVCCRGLGVLTKPTHRRDRVRAAVLGAAGVKDRSDDDEAVRYADELLRGLGYRPQYRYADDVWSLDRPVHEVLQYHLEQLASLTELTPAVVHKVADAVAALAEGGVVHERIASVRTTLFWRMDRQ